MRVKAGVRVKTRDKVMVAVARQVKEDAFRGTKSYVVKGVSKLLP